MQPQSCSINQRAAPAAGRAGRRAPLAAVADGVRAVDQDRVADARAIMRLVTHLAQRGHGELAEVV